MNFYYLSKCFVEIVGQTKLVDSKHLPKLHKWICQSGQQKMSIFLIWMEGVRNKISSQQMVSQLDVPRNHIALHQANMSSSLVTSRWPSAIERAVPGPSRPELSCSCTIIIVLINSYHGCAHSCFSTAVALGEMFPFGPVQLKQLEKQFLGNVPIKPRKVVSQGVTECHAN